VKREGDVVHVFDSTDVASELGLTRGGLVLVALLSGGDYDVVCISHLRGPDMYSLHMQTGLRNCGPSIAHGVAHYGLGYTLIEAAESLSCPELEAFLIQWHEGLCAVL